jgi:arylsulfatase A-like enzyme
LLEGGIRVPMMMRFPGHFSPGKIYPNVVSSLDILPTVLEVTGVKPPVDRGLDGVGLFEELCETASEGGAQRVLFWHFREEFAVREGDWKLVQTKERPEGVQLYNLAADRAEEEDLAKEKPAVYARLINLYENWRSSMAVTGGN